MLFLVLGRGKTGKVVSEIATARGHSVRSLTERENVSGSALTPAFLANIDVVLDFTTPEVVMSNIRACLVAGKSTVVGTTGWYGNLDEVRALVERRQGSLLYGANFSTGTQQFFSLAGVFARTFAAIPGYTLAIRETHHAEKKDAPSGTALELQRYLSADGHDAEITSVREGDHTGMHTLEARSDYERVTLTHEAFSRAAFAEGAVRAAEWLAGRPGFYNFHDVWSEVGEFVSPQA